MSYINRQGKVESHYSFSRRGFLATGRFLSQENTRGSVAQVTTDETTVVWFDDLNQPQTKILPGASGCPLALLKEEYLEDYFAQVGQFRDCLILSGGENSEVPTQVPIPTDTLATPSVVSVPATFFASVTPPAIVSATITAGPNSTSPVTLSVTHPPPVSSTTTNTPTFTYTDTPAPTNTPTYTTTPAIKYASSY
jgi:hypothetical protein